MVCLGFCHTVTVASVTTGMAMVPELSPLRAEAGGWAISARLTDGRLLVGSVVKPVA